IGGSVHIPDDGIRRPLDGVDVVIVVDRLAERQCIGVSYAAAAGIPRAMCRSVVDGGAVIEGPEVLHDVDFAAPGPWRGRNVLAQHPEGGPDALAERKLDARFDSAVLPAPVGGVRRGARRTGLQARRGVPALSVFEGADRQVAVAVLEGGIG